MDVSGFLQHYGYIAVLLGTFAEGETLLVLGGYAAHRGYLQLPWVIASAFVAAVASDQMYFHLSRRYGAGLLVRYPRLNAKMDVALTLVRNHGTLAVLSMRFLWGLRIALPLAIGASGMDARRFLLLNLAASAVWSCVFGLIGFAATELLARWLGHLHRYEHLIIGILVLIAIAVLAWRWWPRRMALQ